MSAIPHDSLPVHDFPGFEHRTLASRVVGGSGLEVWSQRVTAGGRSPVHRHECEEVVVLLRGSGQCFLDGRPEPMTAPCTLVIPAGTVHELVFAEDSELIAVLATTPAPVLAPDGSGVPVPWDTPADA